ncbi:MAG: CAP domain-containing protein [Candidatus Woesebacteria bacterium]
MIKTVRHLFFLQKSNNHKPKLLHVEGIALLFVLVALWQVGVKTLSVGVGPIPAVLGFASTVTIDQVITQTNGRRQAEGLSALTSNSQLSQAAIAKGNDMCTNQYWAHISPAGLTPWVFMKGAGYKYSVAGENLARDFSDTGSMMDAWIASPTHKANIMNGKFREIGVAVVNCSLLGSDTALVVQMFGTQLANQVAGKTTSGATIVQETPIPAQAGTPQVAGQESAPQTLENVNPTLVLPTPISERTSLSFFTPLQMQKVFFIAVIVLVLGVLLVDMWVVEHKGIVRVSSRSLGHVLFFSGILIIILLVKAGVAL